MIVNFWQSYCRPCRKEMPALAAYAKSHPAVKIVGVDILDTQPGAALQLARDSHVAYPLVADPAGNLDGAEPAAPHPGPAVHGVPRRAAARSPTSRRARC